jgi:hypothetical protein
VPRGMGVEMEDGDHGGAALRWSREAGNSLFAATTGFTLCTVTSFNAGVRDHDRHEAGSIWPPVCIHIYPLRLLAHADRRAEPQALTRTHPTQKRDVQGHCLNFLAVYPVPMMPTYLCHVQRSTFNVQRSMTDMH